MAPAADDSLHQQLSVAYIGWLLKLRRASPTVRAVVLDGLTSLPDDPCRRSLYFEGMVAGWIGLLCTVIVAEGVTVAITTAISHAALHAVVSVCIGLDVFCLSGMGVTSWWYYAARRAVREARRRGASTHRYRRAMARAMPSGRTIPSQVLLGVAGAAIAFVT